MSRHDPVAFKEKYEANREYYIDKNMWTRYRRRLADYELQLAAQGGVCDICKKIPYERDYRSGRLKRFGWDHDHRCCPGKRTCGACVRGLVCGACNAEVARVETDYYAPHQAYLKRWAR